MASWKPYRVSDVVSEIDEEKYVLPVIQRELVWTDDKMELLFDSLLKGNSFGGIIVIEEDKDSKPLFASRVFSKDGNPLPSQNKEKLSQTQYFVIDGQQRLQSFYIGLKGTYHGKSLFFDLFSDYKNDYDFEFEKEVALLPASTKEERPIKDCLWYSAKDLLRSLKETGDEEQVAENIINNYNISDSEKKTFITKNVKAFYRNIISVEAIGVAKVTVNKSLPEKEYTYNDINSIKNYQLLDYGTNRGEKNGKAFSVWVNNPEYVKDKKLYIETHLIPTDKSLWSEDRFLEFKEERGKLIASKINSYLN